MMSTLSFALRDSATMLRRDIRHSLRNLPMTLISGLLVPIIMLVLFVYVFGGAIGVGQGVFRTAAPISTTSRPGSSS